MPDAKKLTELIWQYGEDVNWGNGNAMLTQDQFQQIIEGWLKQSDSTEEYPPLGIKPHLTLNATREDLGREVRRVWVEWAKGQPNPKTHWLDNYDSTTPEQREVDCRIGEAIAKLVMTNLSD